jgi:hypothetical protein
MPIESESETFECFMCEKEIVVKRMTTAHPDTPELFQPPQGCWIGQALDEDGDNEVVVTCSTQCTMELLDADFVADDHDTTKTLPEMEFDDE